MSQPTALLAFGSIHGKFKSAFKKLQAIKDGIKNVDFALCVGDFFAPDCDESWAKVKTKQIKAPVHIYILGPSSLQLERYYKGYQEMSDLAENITYLGKFGVFNTLEGLKIAYLSGTFSTEETLFSFNYEHIKRLLTTLSNERVDILLTWSWPTGVGLIPSCIKTGEVNDENGLLSSYLFSKTAPQYHFAGCERIGCDLSIDRKLTDGSSAGVSRFVGLGSVTESKLLWIKGVKMSPFSLSERQDNKNMIHLAEKKLEEFSRRMHQLKTIRIPRSERKRCGSTDGASTSNTKKLRKNECWFCLSGTKTNKSLIVSIGKFCYLALDKGPIMDEHLLLIPIQHFSCFKNTTDKNLKKEIDKFKKALISFFKPNKKPIFFERSCRTIHFQINCVPVPNDTFSILPSVFEELARKYELEYNEYFDDKLKLDFEKQNENYFHVDLNDGHELLITGSHKNFPINIGREALTCKKVLNVPEKAIWQKCSIEEEKILKLVKRIQKKFEPFDFTD